MRKNKKLVCSSVVLIIVLNLLVYANTFKVPFQFDDVKFIENNENILEPLDINALIKTYFLRGIVRWSYAVNYLIGEFNTIGYHIVNLSVHIIISILFFVVLRNLYPNSKWNLPLLAALLFSLHPVQIESVTYLMSRSGLLALFFPYKYYQDLYKLLASFYSIAMRLRIPLLLYRGFPTHSK